MKENNCKYLIITYRNDSLFLFSEILETII